MGMNANWKFDGWPHVLRSQQFSGGWLKETFFPMVKQMETLFEGDPGNRPLQNKKMITLFYQPSLRTRASFEIAMDALGGRVVFSAENAREFSSAKKGESLADTVRVMGIYGPDVIILRYDEENRLL